MALPVSPAALDLGLGDSLRQQLAQQEEERKKKLLQQAQGIQNFAPGTASLFGL